jgi:putative transposase
LVERQAADLSLIEQAELLGLSRSSLYYQAVGPTAAEIALKHRIDELYTAPPFYGSRCIHVQLRQGGAVISRQRVQRYMREMGIAGVCPGPNLSRRNQAHQVYPYLLRGLPIERANQVWGTDITYIRLQGGWLYLVALLDWYSRYVVSWELDLTLELGFVQRAVEAAFAQAQPEILNSDQGSHFTSDWYVRRLQEQGVKISMDGKGRALDNIFTERFWRTLKYEDAYLKDYESPRAARVGLGEYFQFYNYERPHQALGYRTPAELYWGKVDNQNGRARKEQNLP